MKYSKLGKTFLKWFLPICILILLVGFISYKFINQVKEGLDSQGNQPMSYERFKTLSESSPDEYKKPFDILNKYIETKFKDRLYIDEIINRSDTFELLSDKISLKWILNNGTEYLYEITKGTLTPISKTRSKKSPQIEDCMIKFTRNDFDNFFKNKLFDGIADVNLKQNISSLLDKPRTIGRTKVNTRQILKSLYENQAYNFYISFNDITKTVKFIDAGYAINGSNEVIPEKKSFDTLSDYLYKKFTTSDIKDPYFDFEIVHANLNVLYDTIKDLLNNKDSKKQCSIWIGTRNMMTIT
jgi:hypothetical protein